MHCSASCATKHSCHSEAGAADAPHPSPAQKCFTLLPSWSWATPVQSHVRTHDSNCAHGLALHTDGNHPSFRAFRLRGYTSSSTQLNVSQSRTLHSSPSVSLSLQRNPSAHTAAGSMLVSPSRSVRPTSDVSHTVASDRLMKQLQLLQEQFQETTRVADDTRVASPLEDGRQCPRLQAAARNRESPSETRLGSRT